MPEMDLFKRFLSDLKSYADGEVEIDSVRKSVSRINQFIYQSRPDLGTTEILDGEYPYFSEFHKFWKKYHEKILNPQIDDLRCELIADILHDLLVQYGRNPFYELYKTFDLRPEDICKIRYFSANQDFRETIDFEKLFEIYRDDPSIFDKNNILQNPEDFLKNIGITGLSQNDKRVKYSIKASQYLIDRNVEPYDLLSFFNGDMENLRNALISNRGSGFGNKKTDMFLRDMIVLGVWNRYNNFDKIDVASDVNTIKVALRTGILKTDILLISSFLDIFCYQYELIDKMNAKAWRRVWEIWRQKYPRESIESPCLIDYFVYRVIGKEFCKESLVIFKCEEQEHVFKWHSGRNKTCQICFREGKKKNKAIVINKVLPCTDNDGYIAISKSEFVSGDNPVLPEIKECPFISICEPQNKDFRKLNSPKSISILGRTGWESARARVDEGGGGLMS